MALVKSPKQIDLDLEQANRLMELPLACIQNELPYKSGIVIDKPADLKMPIEHHPAFYGCFDWHSAVHGHWSMIYLLKTFPDLAKKQEAIQMLDAHLTEENILQEIAYFSINKESQSFERTYGWAWLLKLQEELYTWDDPLGKKWYQNIKPLADYISRSYIEYLPKLVYPIRVGEHTNTAFGLSFAYDYAQTVGDKELLNSIKENSLRFYSQDANCPITWEPSGHDFLSPCLQELDIMRKVLPKAEFEQWSSSFLPALSEQQLILEPGKIIDRTDGKLVHLDGLNFSRAWCLYAIKGNTNAYNLATEHLDYSLSKITDGDYAGQHWLASFALYAFKIRTELDD
ncbi:DUF2891 domain-containing protein [Namhaeicola litoreus]|uniref:DUF2891 domain-containing protein n=1 Tax=Namhaeicola litoreus TaxID=1052145 RepID=UPI0036720570